MCVFVAAEIEESIKSGGLAAIKTERIKASSGVALAPARAYASVPKQLTASSSAACMLCKVSDVVV